MIKREHLKSAIDAIAARDPAAGYSLSQMLGEGRIDVPSQQDRSSAGNYLSFLFAGREIPVSKFVFFNEGIAPIEQALMVNYGELVRREVLRRAKMDMGYRDMSRDIRREGLRFMVFHEIDYAMARAKKVSKSPADFRTRSRGNDQKHTSTPSPETTRISSLEKIKLDDQPLDTSRLKAESPVWYQGTVGSGIDACFTAFPYCMESLIQVADLNLEFFHVRFLLNCLIRGMENNLFICLVDQQILGLVFITLEAKPFFPEIEIKYIATVANSPSREKLGHLGSLRGIGTFLVSGVWLLAKNELGGVKTIFLDSEIGARRFYQSLGFQSRGLAGYVLKRPQGHLCRAIVSMTNNAGPLKKGTVRDVNAIIARQVRVLRREARSEEEKSLRDIAVASIRECLKPSSNPQFARTAIRALLKYRTRIPESDDLVQYGLERVPAVRRPAKKAQPVLVIQDDRFKLHLENLPHLENPRRIEAAEAVLQHPSLHGKWVKVKPAPASLEDLALVHTPEYIRQVAGSAGKPLTSFDLDTQATAKSYEIARLAVGGVCRLVDNIWNGRGKRGFAFVRPPGHHAGADRAMGFCLFNNVAVGAVYLIERLHAMETAPRQCFTILIRSFTRLSINFPPTRGPAV
ncbi:MAG: hypothetical protein JRJ69_16935 [Deltaproteobacteria bacterium]|nr:hypothetical protein [Deltaproteobacteria bacterium]